MNVGIGKAFTGVFVAGVALVVALVVTREAPDYGARGTFHTTDLVVDNTSTIGGSLIATRAGDPNTHVTAAEGSLIMDSATPALWQNTTGAAVWQTLSTITNTAGTNAITKSTSNFHGNLIASGLTDDGAIISTTELTDDACANFEGPCIGDTITGAKVAAAGHNETAALKATSTIAWDTTATNAASLNAFFLANSTRAAGPIGHPVENIALELDANSGDNNEGLLGDNGDWWQQEFVAGTTLAILLRTTAAGLRIDGGTMPFGQGTSGTAQVGLVDMTLATAGIILNNVVSSFTVPGSPATNPHIGIGSIVGSSIGLQSIMKNTAAGTSFGGAEVGLDTTVNAGSRGGYFIWRGAAGGFGGSNEAGFVMSAATGFPFVESTANSTGLFSTSNQPLFFGADGNTFTSSFGIMASNHIVQSASTGLPGLGGGCTAGGGSSIVGNDKRFEVVMGVGSTSCVVTFVKTYTTKPMCTVTPQGGITFPNVTPAAATYTFNSNVNSGDYVVDCDGQPGGT